MGRTVGSRILYDDIPRSLSTIACSILGTVCNHIGTHHTGVDTAVSIDRQVAVTVIYRYSTRIDKCVSKVDHHRIGSYKDQLWRCRIRNRHNSHEKCIFGMTQVVVDHFQCDIMLAYREIFQTHIRGRSNDIAIQPPLIGEDKSIRITDLRTQLNRLPLRTVAIMTQIDRWQSVDMHNTYDRFDTPGGTIIICDS